MVERIVMESLSGGKKNRYQLFLDTKLDIHLIDNILNRLEKEGLVKREGKDYLLDEERVKEITGKREVKQEVRELFVSWVNRFFAEKSGEDTCLRVKKVYMNEAEEMLYREHLMRLDKFIEEVRKTSRREKRHWSMAKKKVIFWGHGSYQALAEASLVSL